MSWYYSTNESSHGPVSAEDLFRKLCDGTLPRTTLVWSQGMADWQPAYEISALQVDPPPLPYSMGDSATSPPPVSLTEPRYKTGHGFKPSIDHETTNDGIGPVSLTGSDGLYFLAPSRSFSEAISVCFSKFATFSGRASRSEYWFFWLFCILVGFVSGIFDAASSGTRETSGSNPFSSITTLVLFLPQLAVTVRRLHDTGRSGWWYGGPILGMLASILLFASLAASMRTTDPAVGFIVALLGFGFLAYIIALTVFLCFKGDSGANSYG